MMPFRAGVLAYGSDARMHREATIALLTLKQYAPAAADVVVFTDTPSSYRWLGTHVAVEPLSAATLREWRGVADDRFRPKIEALRQMHAGGADALLLDTDTMVRRPLEPLVAHLAAGGFVLHEREYRISSPPRRGDRSLRTEVAGRSWAGVAADDETWMWNGGVIGTSGQHVDVMQRTLTAFDQMKQASRHFALEQLAYSIVFPAFGEVRAASEYVDHYWANRAWFDRRIDRFLSNALMEALTPEVAGTRLREQPIVGPLDGRLSSWQRRIRRVLRIEMDDDVNG
jgi:hypothetical protein